MNQSDIKFKPTIIIILNILLFVIIIYGLFYKNKEGFNIKKEFNKMGKKIEKNLLNKTTKVVNNMGKKIELNLFNKITSIFTKLGNMINEGLIQPLGQLFVAIGIVFEQLINILIKIGNKIGALPGCIIVYAVKSTFDTIFFILKKITPKTLQESFSFVYKYTFRYIFDFIGWITGYTAAVNKCYGFNVSDEVDRMNKGFSNAAKSFKQNFGKLNFSKLV
jgi:hypothetical protein